MALDYFCLVVELKLQIYLKQRKKSFNIITDLTASVVEGFINPDVAGSYTGVRYGILLINLYILRTGFDKGSYIYKSLTKTFLLIMLFIYRGCIDETDKKKEENIKGKKEANMVRERERKVG